MAKRDQVLQKIISLLKREFNPSRLYLFGSRATRTSGSDSDYDFVMVIPRYRGDRMKTWEKCHELIHNEFGVSADVFTYSETEFKNKVKNEFSSIPETAVATGREIDLGT
jgi:DNA polymerase sigma